MRDQYLKAVDVFDSENTRFWTRFNVFTGIQLIVVAGLAANVEGLKGSKPFASVLILCALAFSVFTIFIVWRSYQISLGIYRALLELEQKDESLILLKTYTKHSRAPMGAIARSCVVLSAFLAVFWVVIFCVFLTV